jgi:hypothetical protein
MAHSAAFCRRQEALQRVRATAESLQQVKAIAMRAANAWALEAQTAERRESKLGMDSALPLAGSVSEQEEDRQLSENPDRGCSA